MVEGFLSQRTIFLFRNFIIEVLNFHLLSVYFFFFVDKKQTSLKRTSGTTNTLKNLENSTGMSYLKLKCYIVTTIRIA